MMMIIIIIIVIIFVIAVRIMEMIVCSFARGFKMLRVHHRHTTDKIDKRLFYETMATSTIHMKRMGKWGKPRASI